MARQLPNTELQRAQASLASATGNLNILNDLRTVVTHMVGEAAQGGVDTVFGNTALLDVGTDPNQIVQLDAQGRIASSVIPGSLNFDGTPLAEPDAYSDDRLVVTLQVLRRYLRWQVVLAADLVGSSQGTT